MLLLNCFVHPKRPSVPVERVRIGFGETLLQIFCSQTPLFEVNNVYVLLNRVSLGPFYLSLYLVVHPKGPSENDEMPLEQLCYKSFVLRPPPPPLPSLKQQCLRSFELRIIGIVPFVFLLSCAPQGALRK